MTGYWVARSKINDRVEYKKYTDRIPAIPSLEQAVACHDSPEYQEASAFRKGGAGEVELVIVEGGDATAR